MTFRLRAGTWRGNDRVAYLAAVPNAPAPSPSFVRRCLSELSGQGFSSVVTAGVAPAESHAFVALGFEEHERLRLLSHDLRHLPPKPAGMRPERIRQSDWTSVLAVDEASFSPFWRLDRVGLEQAVAATAASRSRIIRAGSPLLAAQARDEAVGYAITGRAGTEGYVQRLAVRPDSQGRGLGRALALDGLYWLRRHRARRALVNTQQGNEVALSFYRRLGFVPEPADLVVFRRDLT